MKLLICTQAVDSEDSNLAFFIGWIEEFAKHAKSVTVICLRKGTYDLPANVKVLSAGKERGTPRIFRWLAILRYIISYRNNYDTVFVHMNPEYFTLAGWLWRAWDKKTALWYTHASVDRKLRIAESFADKIFTASPESFRLPTQKLKVLGHGIDTKLFEEAVREPGQGALRIITVGRITKSKQVLEILKSLDYLYDKNFSFEFTLIGKPVTKEDEEYFEKVKEVIDGKPYRSHLFYMGSVAHNRLPMGLANADLFINLSLTGSLDKAVLEAFAAGVPAISSNEAFKSVLEPMRLFVPSDPKELADAIERFSARTDRGWVAATLESWVKEHHSLQKLITQIVAELQ